MTTLLAVRRALAVTAAVPLLATALVACGDKDDTAHDSSGSSVDSSAGDASGEGGFGASVLTGLKTGDEVDPDDYIKLVVDGMKASTTAHMTMTTSLGQAGTMTAEGDLDYQTDPPSMAMTMTMPMTGGTKADVRFIDGIFYMSMGDMTNGKFWKLDPSEPGSPLGDLGSMLDGMDPAAMMKRLEPAIDKVAYEGEEKVDDRDLDHYEMTVDGAELGKVMDVPSAAAGQLPKILTYDIWLDSEHRFAQMTMEIPVQGTATKVEMIMDDWGKDVSIEAPPADQITEMPDFGKMAPTPTA